MNGRAIYGRWKKIPAVMENGAITALEFHADHRGGVCGNHPIWNGFVDLTRCLSKRRFLRLVSGTVYRNFRYLRDRSGSV